MALAMDKSELEEKVLPCFLSSSSRQTEKGVSGDKEYSPRSPPHVLLPRVTPRFSPPSSRLLPSKGAPNLSPIGGYVHVHNATVTSTRPDQASAPQPLYVRHSLHVLAFSELDANNVLQHYYMRAVCAKREVRKAA